MLQNKHECFWYAKRVTLTAFVLALGVLIFCGYAACLPKPGGAVPAVPNKDKDKEFTQVYQHTFDEVFQASLETIERMGLFVTAKDKDKGTISGGGKYVPQGATGVGQITFDLHVEAINTKPETRLTAHAQAKGSFISNHFDGVFVKMFPIELQKVLSTYH